MKNKGMILFDYEDNAEFIKQIKGAMFTEAQGAKVWFVCVHDPMIENIYKITQLDDNIISEIVEEYCDNEK